MAENAAERIDKALARIEAAAAARAYDMARLTRRHGALRDSIQQAILALDAAIARDTADAEAAGGDEGEQG